MSEPRIGPLNKRPRNDLGPPQISKHDTLYFHYGNIVLFSLPNDNTVTAYKVYKDFLMLYSPIFEGMLTVPFSPNVARYDGVPILPLYDEAADLTPFLEALYDQTDIPSQQGFYVAPNRMASIFKLSKKYRFRQLLTRMTHSLLEIWPRTLPSWDGILMNRRGTEGFSEKERTIRSILPEPCSSIRIARDYDMPAILPAAFYHLLRTLPQALSDPESQDYGQRTQETLPIGPETRFSSLSQHDFMCFVRGSYAIRSFINDLKLDVVVRPDCQTSNACFEALETFSWKHKAVAHWNGDPFEVFREQGIRFLNPRGICDACLTRYINHMENSRQQLWNSLPTFFGLESIADGVED